jgi:SWI/SNF-related matrix-associated actin-dependent regulator of chromatin subfamily A-like protein 1
VAEGILKPRPWQVTGAEFLAARDAALLADDPRVGKTLAAILACNIIGAERVAIVTTKSGMPGWRRAVVQCGLEAGKVEIQSWSSPSLWRIGANEWDVVIGDECHKAKNFNAARTKHFYGTPGRGYVVHRNAAATNRAKRVWGLSGTPTPHDPSDIYPMLLTLRPDLLETAPNVRKYRDFLARYCVVGKKKLPNGHTIDVIVGGRNIPELRARLDGFILRRTQEEVGIAEPTYDILPLAVDSADLRRFEKDVNMSLILEAAAASDVKSLEMHYGPMKRLTAVYKAEGVAEIAAEELEDGLEKIVIAYWHTSVGDVLGDRLHGYGVLRLDGGTPDRERAEIERLWTLPGYRVFLAQIKAAGESIDLSPAPSLIFCETSDTPSDMRQMALRITNINRPRTPLVRVATLENSIDEKIQERLMNLWTAIKEIYA